MTGHEMHMNSKKIQAIEIGVGLDSGVSRKGKPNQDSIGLALPSVFNRQFPILVLSDGMGAYGGGEVASRYAVKTTLREYRKTKSKTAITSELMKNLVIASHKKISKKAAKSKGKEWMGCTIVIAILGDGVLHVSNVGDSRAYLIGPNGIKQLTFDHSMVAEQLRQGLITAEEAWTHPKRNVLSMSLTGRRESVDPYYSETPWGKDDALLLCSDGLWGVVPEARIAETVLSVPPQKACDTLIRAANLAGGPDNISVVIARPVGYTLMEKKESDITRP